MASRTSAKSSKKPGNPSRPRHRTGASATVKDVARLAGVSAITVSRALNTPDQVSPETLERVRTAISRTGYVPNLLAGGLRSAKSKLVVTLISHPDSPYYRTIDVLNSLAVAGISNVTFTSDSEQ